MLKLDNLVDFYKKYELVKRDVAFAVKYLNKYGYLDDLGDGHLDLNKVYLAVTKFQEFFQLKKDGELGPKTLRAMREPRCAFPDVLTKNSPFCNFELQKFEELRQWGSNSLTYYIHNRVNGLSSQVFDDTIQLAFQQISDVCNMEFRRVDTQSANLIVSVGRGNRDNFDGTGGTLAWAYLPPNDNYRGRLIMKFDLDENWIVDIRERGILLLPVGCHEFMHLMGVPHISPPKQLMNPFYNPAITKPQKYDIQQLVDRYGKPVAPPPPEPEPEPEPEPQNLVIQIKGQIESVKVNGNLVNI